MTDEPSGPGLAAELEDLRARLAEAEAVLLAIRSGEVDAVVVTGGRGEQIYTLSGADRVYRQLIETMSEGAVTLSADGDILYCNVRLAKMLGRPLDQVLGSALRNYLPLADQHALDAILAQARSAPSRGEINLITSEGRLVPVYLSASRLQSQVAEMVFCLVLTDLTEQKRLERIGSAERLAVLILEQAAESIVVCDEQARIIRASQASERFCDGSPLLRPFAEVFPLRTGASEPFHLAPVLQGETLRNLDVALDRQGQELDLILNAGPLLSGQQILGCVVTLTDITERKRAEEARAHREAELQESQRIAGIGSWEWTPATGVVTWSDGLNHILGRERGLPTPTFEALSQFYTPESWQRLGAVIARAIETGASYDLEVEMIRADGVTCWTTTRGEAIRGADGTVVKLRGTVHDITERKKLQEQFLQAQKMETVGQLAGGIAHDFNNLLTVMIATSDLALSDMKEEDPLRVEFQEVRQAAERAAILTRQLLAFSRKQVLQPAVLSLNSVIADMEQMLQRVIREDIKLVFTLAEDLGSVKVDPGQIEQVIMNLAINARDAMPDGGTLTIETRNVELDETYAAEHPSVQRGPHVMLAISDTGVGMEEATSRRIFEPFFTTKEVGKGTGLGLSTVYGIVKQSGGGIEVYSELGKGTVFKIYLPRVEAVAHPGQPATTVTSVQGTETILIVEDDEAVQHLARRLLQLAGYTVLTASNGREALALLERHDGTVHLMLTDMVMPGMGGRELATQLEDIRPRMKVIFTSGYTDDAMLQSGRLNEAAHFIGKPYTVARLTRKVREVLDS